MPIGWPIEALKVQAIISRSMAFSGQKNSLPYSDLSSVYKQSIIAVDETDGLVLSTHKKSLKVFDDIDSSIAMINNYDINKIYDLALKGLTAEKILSQIFPELQLAKIEIGCD